jgi:hypothetical protein
MFRGLAAGLRPIVVPKFVSNPETLNYGYQEAHNRYDKMRKHFAQKAMSAHQGEVVVIKVMMMCLKPGCKNPQVVSVCTHSPFKLHCIE